jgi:hypothetical protein
MIVFVEITQTTALKSENFSNHKLKAQSWIGETYT